MFEQITIAQFLNSREAVKPKPEPRKAGDYYRCPCGALCGVYITLKDKMIYKAQRCEVCERLIDWSEIDHEQSRKKEGSA